MGLSLLNQGQICEAALALCVWPGLWRTCFYLCYGSRVNVYILITVVVLCLSEPLWAWSGVMWDGGATFLSLPWVCDCGFFPMTTHPFPPQQDTITPIRWLQTPLFWEAQSEIGLQDELQSNQSHKINECKYFMILWQNIDKKSLNCKSCSKNCNGLQYFPWSFNPFFHTFWSSYHSVPLLFNLPH